MVMYVAGEIVDRALELFGIIKSVTSPTPHVVVSLDNYEIHALPAPHLSAHLMARGKPCDLFQFVHYTAVFNALYAHYVEAVPFDKVKALSDIHQEVLARQSLCAELIVSLGKRVQDVKSFRRQAFHNSNPVRIGLAYVISRELGSDMAFLQLGFSRAFTGAFDTDQFQSVHQRLRDLQDKSIPVRIIVDRRLLEPRS